VTRRRRPGSTRGLTVAGRQLFAASSGRKSYGAATAAHGTPVTGRPRSSPYLAAAPRHHGQAVTVVLVRLEP
jgi:hypothetical protein